MDKREDSSQRSPEPLSTERHFEVPSAARNAEKRGKTRESQSAELITQRDRDLGLVREALFSAKPQSHPIGHPTAQDICAYKTKSVRLEVSRTVVDEFLRSQGLTESNITDLKIEFVDLRQGNIIDRTIASFPKNVAAFLPRRFRLIFTRAESLSGNTLKIFVNNIEQQCDQGDTELLARDTIHHLVHYAQMKKGEFGKTAWLLSRLPFFHHSSKIEKQARAAVRTINWADPIWNKLISLGWTQEIVRNDRRLKPKPD